jgi:hypothetical protein
LIYNWYFILNVYRLQRYYGSYFPFRLNVLCQCLFGKDTMLVCAVYYKLSIHHGVLWRCEYFGDVGCSIQLLQKVCGRTAIPSPMTLFRLAASAKMWINFTSLYLYFLWQQNEGCEGHRVGRKEKQCRLSLG